MCTEMAEFLHNFPRPYCVLLLCIRWQLYKYNISYNGILYASEEIYSLGLLLVVVGKIYEDYKRFWGQV